MGNPATDENQSTRYDIDAKKKDNEYYASLVKNASSPSSKASYRKSKIDRAASHDRQIESIKRQIENCKDNIARERKRK